MIEKLLAFINKKGSELGVLSHQKAIVNDIKLNLLQRSENFIKRAILTRTYFQVVFSQ